MVLLFHFWKEFWENDHTIFVLTGRPSWTISIVNQSLLFKLTSVPRTTYFKGYLLDLIGGLYSTGVTCFFSPKTCRECVQILSSTPPGIKKIGPVKCPLSRSKILKSSRGRVIPVISCQLIPNLTGDSSADAEGWLTDGWQENAEWFSYCKWSQPLYKQSI